jgi:hypothetical protein
VFLSAACPTIGHPVKRLKFAETSRDKRLSFFPKKTQHIEINASSILFKRYKKPLKLNLGMLVAFCLNAAIYE